MDNVWPVPLIPPADITQKTDYPTQKPEALLELIVQLYSPPRGLVVDAFVGSGTTAVAAQRHGRSWIGCDVNKGAIQTASKRLQAVIGDQIEASKQMSLEGADVSEAPVPAQFSFSTHRVNDYDLQIQHVEAVNLACEHIGVERRRTDSYFDGTLGKKLVKVVPFNHPLTPLDLEELKRELESRPGEDRDVAVVCLGKDPGSDPWIEDWNRLRKGTAALNRITAIELRTDPKYGKFFAHQPARARVKASRKDDVVVIEVRDFLSPSIIERLAGQTGIVKPKIDDWRAMVDCVLIDPAHDGQVFRIAVSDVPARKTDLVQGRYELPRERCGEAVAVKIVDMLGEEVLEVIRLD